MAIIEHLWYRVGGNDDNLRSDFKFVRDMIHWINSWWRCHRLLGANRYFRVCNQRGLLRWLCLLATNNGPKRFPSNWNVDVDVIQVSINLKEAGGLGVDYEQVGYSVATGAKSSWCSTKTARWPGSKTRAARSRKDVCCCVTPRNLWPSENTPCEYRIDRPVCPADAPWSSLWPSVRPIARKSTGSSPNPKTKSSTFHQLFSLSFLLSFFSFFPFFLFFY